MSSLKNTQSQRNQLINQSELVGEKEAVNRSASMGRSLVDSNIDTTAYMTDLSKKCQEINETIVKMPADFKVVAEI